MRADAPRLYAVLFLSHEKRYSASASGVLVFDELAQNGRRIERATPRSGEFLHCSAARIGAHLRPLRFENVIIVFDGRDTLGGTARRRRACAFLFAPVLRWIGPATRNR